MYPHSAWRSIIEMRTLDPPSGISSLRGYNVFCKTLIELDPNWMAVWRLQLVSMFSVHE